MTATARDRTRRLAVPSRLRWGLRGPSVYFYHIRKTGGVSFKNAIFSCVSDGNRNAVWDALKKHGYARGSVDGRPFHILGWRERIRFFEKWNFSFSHSCFEDVTVPRHTIGVTVYRDPVARVMSHYRNLRFLQAKGRHHPALKEEGAWIGENIGDFLDRVPTEHLARQLSMFSKNLDVDEAMDHVSHLQHVVNIRNIKALEDVFEGIFGAPIKIGRDHVTRVAPDPEDEAIVRAHKSPAMVREIEFYERLHDRFG